MRSEPHRLACAISFSMVAHANMDISCCSFQSEYNPYQKSSITSHTFKSSLSAQIVSDNTNVIRARIRVRTAWSSRITHHVGIKGLQTLGSKFTYPTSKTLVKSHSCETELTSSYKSQRSSPNQILKPSQLMAATLLQNRVCPSVVHTTRLRRHSFMVCNARFPALILT